MSITREQIESSLAVVRAVAETIRDAKEVPSGTIYAALSAKGCSMTSYESIIRMLVNGGLIRKSGHVLTWIG